MPDTLSHLVQRNETINLMTSLHSGNVLISFLMAATNPYERVGRFVQQEVFSRLKYTIVYGSKPHDDRVQVHHTVGE